MKYYSSYPSSENKNPFVKLISQNLINSGWQEDNFIFRSKNIFKNRNKISILWFHWPNAHWRDPNSFIKSTKLIRFFYHCLLAKILGYKLVWSAHNVLPHGEESSTTELVLRRVLVALMDLVIGHAKNTKQMLIDKGINPKKYILAIHGNYENVYREKNELITKKSLGFENDDIIILLKSGFKNYESAKIFESCFSTFSFNRIKLLVIGENLGTKEYIKFIPGFISNQDLSSYIALSDFVCLPYPRITTSGAYFLALTFEKPVIAQRIPFFEQHCEKGTAFLYNDCNNLIEMLKTIDSRECTIEFDQISQLKKIYSWANSCKIIADKFNQLIN